MVDVNGFQLSPQSPFRTPAETLSLLVDELEAYQPTLLRSRRALLAANKIDAAADVPHALQSLQAAVDRLAAAKRFAPLHVPRIYPISAMRGDGLSDLALALRRAVDDARNERIKQDETAGEGPKTVLDHLYSFDLETAKYFREQSKRAHERVW